MHLGNDHRFVREDGLLQLVRAFTTGKPPGHFDHLNGAVYLSPLHHETSLPPDFVELHENIHQNLAFNNITNSLAHIYSFISQSWGRELLWIDRRRIKKFVSSTIKYASDVHESVANYHSLLLYSLDNAEQANSLRKKLSSKYQLLIKQMELAFGEITDERTQSKARNILYVLTWSAIAALNIPYPAAECRLSSLQLAVRRLKNNAPDVRFRSLICVLRPHWDPEGLLSDLVSGDDFSCDVKAAQAEVFTRYRSSFPELSFVDLSTRPSFRGEVISAIRTDPSRRYQFFADQIFLDSSNQPDPTMHFYGATVELPGLPEGAPKDLTIVDVEYLNILPKTIAEALDNAKADDLCHVVSVLRMHEPNRPHFVKVLSYLVRPQSILLPKGIQASTGIQHLRRILRNVQDKCILKIDERDDMLLEQLKDTPQLKLVLLWNTASGHVISVFKATSSQEATDIFTFRLDRIGAWWGVLLWPRNKRHCFAAPLTRMGLRDLLEEAKGFAETIVQCPAHDLSCFGSAAPFLQTIILHCYAGIAFDYRVLTKEDEQEYYAQMLGQTPMSNPDSSSTTEK